MAERLELMLDGALKPAPKGIYSFSQVEPVMVDGVQYVTKLDSGAYVPFTDINALETAIYRENGSCVISRTTMRNKAKMLSDLPILPYRGYHIAWQLYERYITERVQWRRRGHDHLAKIYSHLLDEAYAERDELERDLDEFSLEIDAFLGPLVHGHEWHIYHTKARKPTSIVIERGIDYRIQEFNRLLDEGVIKL